MEVSAAPAEGLLLLQQYYQQLQQVAAAEASGISPPAAFSVGVGPGQSPAASADQLVAAIGQLGLKDPSMVAALVATAQQLG